MILTNANFVLTDISIQKVINRISGPGFFTNNKSTSVKIQFYHFQRGRLGQGSTDRPGSVGSGPWIPGYVPPVFTKDIQSLVQNPCKELIFE